MKTIGQLQKNLAAATAELVSIDEQLAMQVQRVADAPSNPIPQNRILIGLQVRAEMAALNDRRSTAIGNVDAAQQALDSANALASTSVAAKTGGKSA